MNNTRIVVLGGTGMLRHKMFQTLRERFAGVVCTVREGLATLPCERIDLFQGHDVIAGLDGSDFRAVETRLALLRPEFIINCVGIIKQRTSAFCAIPSITINSLLPHMLAKMAERWGGRVIHFSTDCVFSGKKGNYVEEDCSDAEDLYGKSKFLGEVACANAVTLRTSIIGRELKEHRSLLDWFLAQNHKAVRGFRQVIYSGVTTNHLALLAASLIESFPDLNGLYQVASEPISKYSLLGLLRDAYKMDIQIEPYDQEVSDRSLNCGKLIGAIGYKCPSWQLLVQNLAEDPTPYENWIGLHRALS